MGWCEVTRVKDHDSVVGLDDGSYFYFVHSYAVPVGDRTVATAVHREPFSAVIAHENFWAAQFHPERSSTAGATLLRRFIEQ